MNVLTDRIGRRIDLKIIHIEIAGNQVRCVKDHALPRLRPEEEWLGGTIPVQCLFDILLQDRETSLRVMPARFIDRHIHLDIDGTIFTRLYIMNMTLFVNELLGARV